MVHAQVNCCRLLRDVERLRHSWRSRFFQGFESTGTNDDARWTTGSGVLPKEFDCPCQTGGAPASGQWRPVFVVGINNMGKQPIEFRVAQVEAVQHVAGSDFDMKIVTYEMLVQEEKNRQVAAATFTGVAGRDPDNGDPRLIVDAA